MNPSITQTLFRRLAAPTSRLLYTAGLAAGLLACLAEISFAQSDCGKYLTTANGCRRVAVLPWYAGQAGVWETEFRADAGSAEDVKFAYLPAFALVWDGVGHNLALEDNQRGGFIAEEVDHVSLGRRQSYRAKILGSVSCQQSTCTLDNGVSTGSLLLIFDAPNATALENTSANAVYRHFASDSSLDAQVTASVIFLDQASSEWSTSIIETPRTLSSPVTASTTMFAVANLSPLAQAVVVEVFNESGQIVASAKTPVLAGATGYLGDMGSVGGVHANYLAGLSGINLAGFGGADFHGTLVFRGDQGGLIAPVVFQANGSLMISSPVSPALNR
jgi:hypothetical protein